MFCLHPVSSALPDETRNWPDTRTRQLEMGAKAHPWFCFISFCFFFVWSNRGILISNETLHLVFDIVWKMIKNMSSNIIISHFRIFFYGNQNLKQFTMVTSCLFTRYHHLDQRTKWDWRDKTKTVLFLRFSRYFYDPQEKVLHTNLLQKINPDKHAHELCNYNSLERQPPYLYFGLL